MSAPLVIGIGNPDRGDDGVGYAVARRIGDLAGAEISCVSGEPTEIIDLFEGRDSVWLVDACKTGAPAGTLFRVDLSIGPLPEAAGSDASTHGFGVGMAVELARSLGVLPTCCILHAVEAGQYDHGAGLSPEVAAVVNVLADRIAREVRTCRDQLQNSA